MLSYYNEHDPYAAQWLRNLIAAGHIAPGIVDERDIRDVTPAELVGFTQCHFFAGIGVWSHALRRSGWSDDRPVWTGSCPCQPFSAAGARGGVDDERHLWPHWFWLIEQCRPPVILGEQVASKDGLGWLDLVSADLEGADYAVGASDLCAAGFGGAHIRQRLYFVGLADSEYDGLRQLGHGVDRTARTGESGVAEWKRLRADLADGFAVSGLDDDDDARPQGHAGDGGATRRKGSERPVAETSISGGLADTNRPVPEQPTGTRTRSGEAESGRPFDQFERCGTLGGDGRPRAPMLGWNAADWLFCRDGKWRPVEPGTFPLAHAAPARVGRLRAYGNGLDAETATGFVQAAMDVLDGRS